MVDELISKRLKADGRRAAGVATAALRVAGEGRKSPRVEPREE
ncbi:hypothetical protein [Paraburkholderia xenovorans]